MPHSEIVSSFGGSSSFAMTEPASELRGCRSSHSSILNGGLAVCSSGGGSVRPDTTGLVIKAAQHHVAILTASITAKEDERERAILEQQCEQQKSHLMLESQRKKKWVRGGRRTAASWQASQVISGQALATKTRRIDAAITAMAEERDTVEQSIRDLILSQQRDEVSTSSPREEDIREMSFRSSGVGTKDIHPPGAEEKEGDPHDYEYHDDDDYVNDDVGEYYVIRQAISATDTIGDLTFNSMRSDASIEYLYFCGLWVRSVLDVCNCS